MTPGAILRRLRASLLGKAAERAMQEELRGHLDAAAARYRAQGMAPRDAMAAARHEFGNVEHVKEQLRDARGFVALDDLLRDGRHALRSLFRSPGFTATVAGTLSLGVAALTMAFAVTYAALWRAPPIPKSADLRFPMVTVTSARNGVERGGWSYANATAMHDAVAPAIRVASYTSVSATVARDDDPEFAPGEIVSPAYFAVLGIAPVMGRAFRDDEDGPGIPAPVVLLSHDEWRARFNSAFTGDSSAIGQAYRVNGRILTIVGVMPEGFRGLTNRARFWVTTGMATLVYYGAYQTTNQNFINVVGRLAPGTSGEQADDAVRRFVARLGAAATEDPPDATEQVGAVLLTLNEARTGRVTKVAAPILLAAVALLYLLACANAANLMLGRAVVKRQEYAVRAALGGGTRRIAWQAVAGALVLIVAACGLGVAAAAMLLRAQVIPAGLWGGALIRGVAPFADPRTDAVVLVFAAVLTLLTIMLVLWAPATGVAGLSLGKGLGDGLRSGSRGASSPAATLRRPTVRGALVAGEAAIAMVLLTGGGLMVASFAKIRAAELGVARDHVLTFSIRPSEARYPPERAPTLVARIVGEIERVPGVEAVSVDGGAPVTGSARGPLFIVGRPLPAPREVTSVRKHYVAPDHFRVLGIDVLRGRRFTPQDDAHSPRVAIVSMSAAERFWPGGDPLGQRIWFGPPGGLSTPDSAATIVGVVSDAQYDPVDRRSSSIDVYTPFAQFTYAGRTVFVRTAGHPVALVPSVRRAVRTVDPDIALIDVKTLDELIGNSWARQRFDAQAFGTFAMLALLLSTGGLYAVVAHGVAQRTREMGIRLALGADRRAIVRLVVREGLAFPAIGVLVGIVGAVMLGRVLQSLLYDVGPADPLVLGGAGGLLLVAAAIACLIPARRATRADPTLALRAE